MPVCEYCGKELTKLIEFDYQGNEVWECPNDCAFLRASERIKQQEDAKSHDELVAEYEILLARYIADTTKQSTHCWTFRRDGTHCPGVIYRTEETWDRPYGNFCPVCGHSLRYHPYYGQGCPGDLGKR